MSGRVTFDNEVPQTYELYEGEMKTHSFQNSLQGIQDSNVLSKAFFSKRNIENIDNSLYSLGWERVSQITSPDILNGNLGLPYSKWFNEYGEEEIYLFDSKGSSDNILQQVKCIKDNILNDDNPAQGFNYKRYIVITQAQDDVNILAVIFYDQHQN